MSDFPENVHVSSHPVLEAKLSQLRQNISARETRLISKEIATILAVWMSGEVFTTTKGDVATSAAGAQFTTSIASPATYTLVPVLRSGLAMVDRKCTPDLLSIVETHR